jgi:hypothetical protein
MLIFHRQNIVHLEPNQNDHNHKADGDGDDEW